MKFLLLLLIGYIFYMINRGYRPEDYQYIKADKKQMLKGDLENHEAGLLVSLMAKVAKADGKVCELESQLLGHTFTDLSSHFENSEQIRDELKKIYLREKETFENTIEVSRKYLRLTRNNYMKRQKLIEYLLNLAFIDKDFGQAEFLIIEDIAKAINLKKYHLKNMILQFENFYKNYSENKLDSLEKAYETLELNSDASLSDARKKYRSLVRENHPDIVTGRGANQSIIDEATKKLQDINEAYEIIKKSKK